MQSNTLLLSFTGDSANPTIPFGKLLRDYHLGLVLIAGADSDTHTKPVRWVHVSELADPSPYLPPLSVLLTTGARTEVLATAAAARDYVAKLVAAQVPALGFGIGLHWERVPPQLVSACDELGLPLFRVPLDTAFAEIARTATNLLTAITRDRDLWALDAQRAVTQASLQRDPLAAVIRETAARLTRWVAVTDRTGQIIEVAWGSRIPSQQHTAQVREWLRSEARRLISRGVSAARIERSEASSAEDGSESGMRLEALGRGGTVLGVLAVADAGSPDTAERSLLGLVAALTTAQLEQRAGQTAAQEALHGVAVQLLQHGQLDLAAQVCRGAGVRLPQGSIAAVRFAASSMLLHDFAADLQSFAAASRGVLPAGLHEKPLIISEARHLPQLRRLFAQHRVAAGISRRGRLDAVQQLLTQAERALSHAEMLADMPATTGRVAGPVDYVAAQHSGLLELLDRDAAAHDRALELLAPLRQHDSRSGEDTLRCLQAWLGAHGNVSQAAEELGLHRHTLRTRLQTVAAILQADLDAPDTRAELWTAIRLLAAGGVPAAAAPASA